MQLIIVLFPAFFISSQRPFLCAERVALRDRSWSWLTSVLNVRGASPLPFTFHLPLFLTLSWESPWSNSVFEKLLCFQDSWLFTAAGLMLGLKDLQDHFQPTWFYVFIGAWSGCQCTGRVSWWPNEFIKPSKSLCYKIMVLTHPFLSQSASHG